MFDSSNEFVLSAIVVLLGGVLTLLVGKWLGRPQPVVVLLYLWHTVLGFFYSSYVLTYGGDAWDYYQHAHFITSSPTSAPSSSRGLRRCQ